MKGLKMSLLNFKLNLKSLVFLVEGLFFIPINIVFHLVTLWGIGYYISGDLFGLFFVAIGGVGSVFLFALGYSFFVKKIGCKNLFLKFIFGSFFLFLPTGVLLLYISF